MAILPKRRLLRHPTIILIIMASVVYIMWLPLRIVFQSRDEYAIHLHTTSPSDSARDDESMQPQLIPKIIHQVYNIWSNGSLPDDWQANRKSCMDLHPEFEFKLWNKETAEQLLGEDYPWFLDTYHSYPYPVQRADAIRYFILLKYGGVYIDLDEACARPLDPLLKYPAFMAASAFMGLSNRIMGSMPGHMYFANLVSSLKSYALNWILPYLTIMNATGPHFVSFVWMDHLSQTRGNDTMGLNKVHLLMADERSGSNHSLFHDGRGKSWYNWDNAIFFYIEWHPFLTASLILPAVAVIYLSICFVWGVQIGRRQKTFALGKDHYLA